MVVIDSGRPRNAAAEGVRGFLTRDGISPSEFIVAGRREVTGYGAQILEGTVTSVQRSVDGFVVCLADGVALHARKLLIGTGLVDELPDVDRSRKTCTSPLMSIAAGTDPARQEKAVVWTRVGA